MTAGVRGVGPGRRPARPAAGLRRVLRAALAAGLLALPAGDASAQLACLETEDLRLVSLDPYLSYLTPYAARCFESALHFHEGLFGYTPPEKVNVLMLDLSDFGRASAGPLPRDNVQIQVAPVNFAFETMAPNERINTIMNHELTHVMTMDASSRGDRRARGFFGGKVLPTPDHPETIGYMYLTAPRVAVPGWYLEGIAVFMETWMAGGIGRAQGAYDEMVFRSMVRDGARFYDPLGLVSEGTRIDFQVGVNSYLYGTRFMSWLALTESPESLLRWVNRSDGTRAYYARQFREVYGRSIEEAWQEWIAWERDFQGRNLEAIRQFPTTPYRDLSPRALGSVSRAFLDPEARRLYTAFNYPGVVAHIGAIDLDDGAVERIVEVKDPVLYSVTSLAWDPDGRILFYTADNSAWRDLRSVDPRTGEARTLMRDARIGDLVFDRADGSLWGLRQLNGLTTLVRVPRPYLDWARVLTFPYGEVPYDLDISPDGRLLSASIGEVSGRHTLRVFDLEKVAAGALEAKFEVDFGTTIPSGFVFSPDGRFLYGSSYYTGVSNIFRIDAETGAREAVSNCETGMFRPVPVPGEDGRLIVFRYSGEGFVPAEIDPAPLEDVSAITFLGQQVAETHPIVTTWKAPSPAQVPIEDLVTLREEYRSFRTIRPESFYPVVEGYKDSWAVGFSANFSDPVGLNRATLTASYSPDSELPSDERLHAEATWRRYDWRARLRYNDADFYDLFGPTKRSRKGWSAGVGHKSTFIHDAPRELTLDTDLAYYSGLDALPYYQNVAATFDTLVEGYALLSYSNTRASLGAVDAEKGLKTEGLLAFNQVHGEFIPLVMGTLDVGFALPWAHSSIWLRNAAGNGFGDTADPYSNFFFGGFGNNWIDQGTAKRYREWYAFPGVELNDIGGRHFAKTMIEWTLPPVHFRNAGTPGFYLTWARPAVFIGGITTNFNEAEGRRKVADAGAQMDFRLYAMSQLEFTLSMGYAAAFESGEDTRHEAMVSLKILR